ncbi:hypothetical protein [Piscinibacter sakaiensis]|uniref:hypothetical protein n=1 Tax=Piscinibacter sakaiensis TaxID=1547922 RepID=UPI003AAF2892
MDDCKPSRRANNEIDREHERRVERGSRRLGWLIGPVIVVATLLVATGCDSPLPPPAAISDTR